MRKWSRPIDIRRGFPENNVEETRAWISASRGRDPFSVQTTTLPAASAALEHHCLLAGSRQIGQKLADEEDQEEIDTLGGLVFMLAGHVPVVLDKTIDDISDAVMTIGSNFFPALEEIRGGNTGSWSTSSPTTGARGSPRRRSRR